MLQIQPPILFQDTLTDTPALLGLTNLLISINRQKMHKLQLKGLIESIDCNFRSKRTQYMTYRRLIMFSVDCSTEQTLPTQSAILRN